MHQLPVPVGGDALTTPSADAPVNPSASLVHYTLAAHAPATRRAYAAALRDWDAHARRSGATTLPATPETVAAYLAQLADQGVAVSTLMQRVAALAYAHRLAGLQSPTEAPAVRSVVRGIRRELACRPDRKAPATVNALSDMLGQVPATMAGRRDRALLLVGFAGAFRRSELVAIDLEDLEGTDPGLIVYLRRSKTDQEGQGRQVAVLRGTRHCPVQALQDWLQAAEISEGPVFRRISASGLVTSQRLYAGTVARIVKRYAKAAGLDPDLYAGHSLRAGFATAALDAGADLAAVAAQLGHAKLDTTRIYDRRSLFHAKHAGRRLL
jgi:site-specific recombinase XerD